MKVLTLKIILEDAVLRNDLNKKSFIIEDNLELGSVLNIYAEYENWYKVRTIEGIPGFIEKQFIKVNYSKNLFKVEKQDNIEVVENNPMLSLTWDYFNRKTTSANINNIKYISGLNVVSPTWFDIVDLDGNIKDKGNIDYVNKYNEMGSDVWPLITNDFNPDLTHDILSNSTKREKLINDILKLYISYGVQGINIDFENVHLKTKDYLTQFVRELYPVFNEANMKVSIDVTGISTSTNWSMCYDRTRLGEVVDYMMLMAYDQHWASSPVAGSVAEYYWVENTIAKVLSQVPNEKLILGIPFYTRLWITKDGKLTSQALSMSTANTFIDENNIELIWDETAQQYYGELEKNNSLYRIWVEDENSIAKKISLVHKYNLAGIASWRKGFETENIWGSMDKTLN